jgi:hypothetical protein
VRELGIFVGEWAVDARFPGVSAAGSPPARSVFEWLLDGRYLA